MAIELFLFAHQDDESAVFDEIRLRTAEGQIVVIVYLTSGDLKGAPSPVRNAESSEVLGALGVSEPNIIFLGERLRVPDGKLSKHLEHVWWPLVALVNDFGGLNSVHMPAWEGGHQDHDAAHLLGLGITECFNIHGNAFQFPFYHGAGLSGPFFRFMVPLSANGDVLRRALAWEHRFRYLKLVTRYRSQWRTWVGLGPFFFFHHLKEGTQLRQRVSVSRVAGKPHAGRLLYERRGFADFEAFVEDTTSFIARIQSGQLG